jgi:predicted nucleic-acid-binding Zn-ribbon protein
VTFQTCLRCGSTERYFVKADGDNGQIHLSGTLKNLRADTYVCGDCGYVERYVTQESTQLLRQRAVRVTTAN